jgi:hypothetical protein
MSKDNIIQFPTQKGENDYLNGDIDYLANQLENNLHEIQAILKELESLVKSDLVNSMSEFKEMTGVDLSPLLPDDDNPKED